MTPGRLAALFALAYTERLRAPVLPPADLPARVRPDGAPVPAAGAQRGADGHTADCDCATSWMPTCPGPAGG